MPRRVRPRSAWSSLALLALSVAVIGCGGDDDYENKPRPPVPRNVTAVVTDSGVTVSPASIQAGPINVIISNQSGSSQFVSIEEDQLGSNPGREGTEARPQPGQVGPINPQDTATIQYVVRPETNYKVKTDDEDIDEATLRVGEEAPSSQNEVLLP